MSAEKFSYHSDVVPIPTTTYNAESLLESSDAFDLNAFFDPDTEMNEKEVSEIPELLVALQSDAEESIPTLTMNITAQSFATGAAMTTGVFSALGKLAGACGLFCEHGLGSLAQASSRFSGGSFRGDLSPSIFGLDSDGNISAFSRLTGISVADIVSGNYSTSYLISIFHSVLGVSMGHAFGFGMVEGFMNSIFNCFLPVTSSDSELSAA